MAGLFEHFYIKKLGSKKYYNGDWNHREMWSDTVKEAKTFESREEVIEHLRADSKEDYPKFLEDENLKIEIKSFFSLTE